MSSRSTTSSAEVLPIWCSNNGPEADLVISTRVRLARNLVNHKFPHFANKVERQAIYSTITSVLKKKKEFDSFSLFCPSSKILNPCMNYGYHPETVLKINRSVLWHRDQTKSIYCHVFVFNNLHLQVLLTIFAIISTPKYLS